MSRQCFGDGLGLKVIDGHVDAAWGKCSIVKTCKQEADILWRSIPSIRTCYDDRVWERKKVVARESPDLVSAHQARVWNSSPLWYDQEAEKKRNGGRGGREDKVEQINGCH
jgi:hypothetical protein